MPAPAYERARANSVHRGCRQQAVFFSPVSCLASLRAGRLHWPAEHFQVKATKSTPTTNRRPLETHQVASWPPLHDLLIVACPRRPTAQRFRPVAVCKGFWIELSARAMRSRGAAVLLERTKLQQLLERCLIGSRCWLLTFRA